MAGASRRRRLNSCLPSLLFTLARLVHGVAANADLAARDVATDGIPTSIDVGTSATSLATVETVTVASQSTSETETPTSTSEAASATSSSSSNITIPAPISFSPAQNWEGIDGTWNTFTLQVGSPPQTVRVQISTASQQTWVVAPRGCEDIQISDCSDNRGGLFFSNESSSWDNNGRFLLWTEGNLGYEGDGDYGWDVVTLGGQGQGGPTLRNTTVGGMGTEDFWFGHFGVNPKPTNWTSFNDPSQSYMTLLKDAKKIPSVSFGYTAGAQYRFNAVLSSLTLGGYDASRFVENDLTWGFAPDNERDIVVAIQSISSVTSDGKQNDGLLPNPVYIYIDSTVPQIWLPLESCLEFEKEFGLSYDNDTNLYLVDNNLHTQLITRNPNITFTLATGLSGGSVVNISLPYAAFDMTASPPYRGLIDQQRYFPLRRAANNTQYTLGRAFLQEAYLTVDWERESFNVSQCNWSQNLEASIVAIQSVDQDSNGGSSSGSGNGSEANTGGDGVGSVSLSTGAIIGIAVGIGAAVALVVCALFFFIRRKRHHKREAHEKMDSPDPDSIPKTSHGRSQENVTQVFPKHELDADANPRGLGFKSNGKDPTSPTSDGDTVVGTYMSEGNGTQTSRGVLSEADGKPREIFEMPGDMPARQEAGGRQLDEKQVMMVREARINGVAPISPADAAPPALPNGGGSNGAPSPLTPTSGTDFLHGGASQRGTQRGRRQVRPGEVIELSPFERDNLTMGLVSPVGPGSGSDGHGTNWPLSPLGSSSGPSEGTATTMVGDSPVEERARRRFSYE